MIAPDAAEQEGSAAINLDIRVVPNCHETFFLTNGLKSSNLRLQMEVIRSVVTALILGVVAAQAQPVPAQSETPNPPDAAEPGPADSAPPFAPPDGAEAPLPPPVMTVSEEMTRPISLEEAIRLALAHNFDIQIERYNPDIFRYRLTEAYAAYEPTFDFSYQHFFNSSPGSFSREGVQQASTESDTDVFSAGPGISGLVPGGLSYSLNLTASKSEISSTGFSGDQYDSGASIQLRQPLLRDFPMDQPRFQIRLNRQNIEISEWTYRERVMAIITSVERAYNNLIFARESVKVQQKALELVERLLVENRKRVEVGAMAPLDEQQAKSQVATTRAQLLDAERALEAQENAFINLITDAYREWHNIQIVPTESLVPIPVTLDLSESWRKGLALRPDLHRARLGIEQSELTTRFNRNQLLPRLDLVGSYGHNARGQDISYGRLFDDLGAGQNPRYSYGVVLSVPMGNFAARNRYKESKAQNAQVELQYRQLEQQVLVEIDDAVKLVETNFDRVSSTREARLFGEAALDAEQKKLENGKSTSFFVLQFQRDLTSARFDEIRALAEYNNALAQLAFLEGTTLERHKIEMEVK